MGSYNGKLIEPLVLSIANSAKNIWLIITPHYNSLNNSPIITPPPKTPPQKTPKYKANIKQKKNNYYVWNCINFQHSGADS